MNTEKIIKPFEDLIPSVVGNDVSIGIGLGPCAGTENGSPLGIVVRLMVGCCEINVGFRVISDFLARISMFRMKQSAAGSPFPLT